LARYQTAEVIMVAVDVGMRWAGAHRWNVGTLWAGLAASAVAVAGWLGRVECGLTGHVMVRQFEPHRMSLECLRCGERTAGWTFDDRLRTSRAR
jgi:hypothetical protein